MPLHSKLMFFVTEDWYFCAHRLPLAVAAHEAGYDVSVVTRVRSHGDRIKAAGLRLIPLELSRRSVNPLREAWLVQRLVSLYRAERPRIVHHIALKPILYGTIAARLAGVPSAVNAFAGLGFLFSSNSLKARMLRPVIKRTFRVLLNRAGSRVIIENPDDVRLMCEDNTLRRDRITLIRGVGVDTEYFRVQPDPGGEPVVMLAGRLLWDKGVGEFVAAAGQLRRRGVRARFVLVGESDAQNPSAIPDEQLRAWQAEGVIEWWGRREDMPAVYAQSHVVCLPSYREGLPTVLTEAGACGRPVVATDVPGCREVVRDGENGLLVPVRDADAVARALERLIESPDLRARLGARGREIVEQEFTQKKVNQETLSVYEALMR
jgi:glycosyltransferase involved in cell wall biosynthesis